MNTILRRLALPISKVCCWKQSWVEGATYSQLLSNHRQQVFNQKRLLSEESFESELEELKYQQLPEQELPEPSSSNVHPIMNFAVVGYDCTVVEHYAQYVHNLANHMGIDVFDMYALPGKTTLIHTKRKQGISDNLKPKDFQLKEHERIIQVQDLSSTVAPLFIEVLLQSIPQGLLLDIKPHTQEQYQSRFIKKEVPDDV
ncbi:39S ribosomal protein L48, mitochondrial-like isoform X2 [Anneissia japonica]|uniref:39S ribosomal protein L48, mitochondrial-like isoform X2 n=1 Tax=Anneissia japonica TaxID=1529436 RepID=UPI001425A2E3|nr:39S ribosomal protein L48, mitochondrial-like isoform X2 [Anneissia japonica]XP_033097167.1 39S ribosomal protein L48, mitochondrial-like isoform X2 [Anneissia japonica]